MFGQLSNRERMRDLIFDIEAHHQKCYHLGLGKHVTRSNLSKGNTNHDYRIFEEYAYYLVSEARRKRATDIFKLDGNVYAFDSTTISLCLDVFWWAKFRKHKGGIKIHTLYDLSTSKSKNSGVLLRMLSEYRFTLPSVPIALLPLYSMICDWIEALMRYCKSSACHSLTQRISEISSTKLYSKMTKTEAVQVNLIYLIFKLVHF